MVELRYGLSLHDKFGIAAQRRPGGVAGTLD
jgi:hypothetical protein